MAAGSEAVLIISGAVVTVIDRVAEAEADGLSESLTFTVKLAVLPTAGTPAIRPVAGPASARPAARPS